MTNSAANENVKVTYKKGEDRCHCCGRYIRNIVEIDGVPYGTKCADGFLPRGQRVGKDFDLKLAQQKRDDWQAEANALRQIALDQFGFLPMAEHVNQWIASRPIVLKQAQAFYAAREYRAMSLRGFNW